MDMGYRCGVVPSVTRAADVDRPPSYLSLLRALGESRILSCDQENTGSPFSSVPCGMCTNGQNT
eukprot:scaffold21726_cov47-Attheya_sp.AAC.1